MDINSIIFFGDSFSDAGRGGDLCHASDDPHSGSAHTGFQYRWSQILPELLDIVEVSNYAVCGHDTEDLANIQLVQHLASIANTPYNSSKKKAAFIWVGANDTRKEGMNPLEVTEESIQNIKKTIKTLHKADSAIEVFVIFNMEPIELLPALNNPSTSLSSVDTTTLPNMLFIRLAQYLKDGKGYIHDLVSNLFNKGIVSLGEALGSSYNSAVKDMIKELIILDRNVALIDIDKLFRDAYAHPEQYELKNPSHPCFRDADYKKTCNTAMFYDWLHPTYHFNEIIADYTCRALQHYGMINKKIDCNLALLTEEVDQQVNKLACQMVQESGIKFVNDRSVIIEGSGEVFPKSCEFSDL